MVLPEFATPDWLRENHHLMKADLRKLAAAIREEYANWPSEADGTDETTFWQAVHDFAGRWTWFLWLFEERITRLFGRVKGGRKQLVPRILKSASDHAREVRTPGSDLPEPSILDDLETLWDAGQHRQVAECVWALYCLDTPHSRIVMRPWLDEPEIDSLVGVSIRRTRSGMVPEHGDILERLLYEPIGTHLERLIERADALCAELRVAMADDWSRLRKHVSAHDAFQPAADTLSALMLDLESDQDLLETLEITRLEAVTRCRRLELGAMLRGTLDSAAETRFAEQADAMRTRVATLLEDDNFPVCVPDPEWEDCRSLAERFHSWVVEPGQHEQALQEAARRYAEAPVAANLAALQAATEAVHGQTPDAEPETVLDAIADCFSVLVERFGCVTELEIAGEHRPVSGPEDQDPTASAEELDLIEENREMVERIAELQLAIADAEKVNAALRRERHHLLQRVQMLEGGAPVQEEDRTPPPLPDYATLPDWVERHFEGRVSLAGRALRALKAAEFEDVELVGRSIELLAGTYWRMKTEGGKALREEFEDELRELRLLETPSLSRTQQGLARDDFTIEWNGRRLTLDRHLKNNAKTRDPRYCFRLYFAWDDVARQVVIGYLPGHMKT